MSNHQPRFPIAIIGGGLAGLSAGFKLQQLGIPFIVLERFERCGGRMNSRVGDGWIADHGAQYFKRTDQRVCNLVRAMGMESNRVTIQGGVYTLTKDGRIVRPADGGLDVDRLTIDVGLAELPRRLSDTLHVRNGCGVSAIRWDNDESVFWWDKPGKVFWFEDDGGNPLRDPESQELIKASGVILATTATAARKLAEKSPALEAIEPILHSVSYNACFTAMFRVPRVDVPYYALQGEPDQPLAWVAFEEKKSPLRVQDNYSLIVVQLSDLESRKLFGEDSSDALDHVYTMLRKVVSHLPEKPYSQTYKRWNASRLESAPLGHPRQHGYTDDRWPINPAHAPFELAGDYIYGAKLEDAVRAGEEAAERIIQQLPARRRVLGLELPVS